MPTLSIPLSLKRTLALGSLLALAVLAANLTGARPAHAAAPFTVSSTADVAGSCNPTTKVCTSLRAAVTAANASSGETIDLAVGQYRVNTPLTIEEDVTLVGHGNCVTCTVIDGQKLTQVFEVEADDPDDAVNISNLLIVNGFGSMSEGDGFNCGGGINNEESLLNLTDVVVTASRAFVGGGICNDFGVVNMKGGRVTANLAVFGGGVFSFGDGFRSLSAPGLTVTSTSIDNNAAGHGGGAGVEGTAFFDHTAFDTNRAGNGGGLKLFEPQFEGTTSAIVVWSAIKNNLAKFEVGPGGQGGAAVIEDSTSLNVAWSEISSNMASGEGGGVWNAGLLNVTNDTFAGNLASDQANGGAIIQKRCIQVSANVRAALKANGTKGARTAQTTDSRCDRHPTANVSFATISGNGAIKGGGVFNTFNDDAFQLKNTILSANTGGNCFGSVESKGSNLEDANTCSLSVTGDQTNTDPNLGPLQNNGGPTQTMALQTGSPAIDTADPACKSIDGSVIANDQRGVTRPQGPRCDIGAFEAQVVTTNPTPTPPSVPSPPVTGTGSGLSHNGFPFGALVAGLVALVVSGFGLMIRLSRA